MLASQVFFTGRMEYAMMNYNIIFDWSSLIMAISWQILHFFNRIEQIFETVDFYFVDRTQQHTKFTIGEAFPVKPFEVRNRQIA